MIYDQDQDERDDADQMERTDRVCAVSLAVFIVFALILIGLAFALRDSANRGPVYCPASPGVEGCR